MRRVIRHPTPFVGPPDGQRRPCGQSILVLEDEPLIALDICEALKGAGASVFVANCLRDALALADHPDLSAAILDFGLSDGDAGPVCSGSKARYPIRALQRV